MAMGLDTGSQVSFTARYIAHRAAPALNIFTAIKPTTGHTDRALCVAVIWTSAVKSVTYPIRNAQF